MTRQYRPLDRPAIALNSAGLDMDQGMERFPIRLRARHTFWRRHPTAAPDAPTTHWVPEGWVIFPSFAIVGAGALTAAPLARTRALSDVIGSRRSCGSGGTAVAGLRR
jgi:hypothetical protein